MFKFPIKKKCVIVVRINIELIIFDTYVTSNNIEALLLC